MIKTHKCFLLCECTRTVHMYTHCSCVRSPRVCIRTIRMRAMIRNTLPGWNQLSFVGKRLSLRLTVRRLWVLARTGWLKSFALLVIYFLSAATLFCIKKNPVSFHPWKESTDIGTEKSKKIRQRDWGSSPGPPVMRTSALTADLSRVKREGFINFD